MSNISTIIKKTKDSFSKKAHGGMVFDKEAFFAMQAVSKNAAVYKIALDNPQSLQNSMINVAAIGLSLNPANQDAYLVPRDNSICLDISYKGLIKLATNTGSIKWAQAEIVYSNDLFTYRGIGEKPVHESNPFGGDRGDPVGVYCVAKTVDGDNLVTTMDKTEINAVRETSKAKNSSYSPWQTFPLEMWKKSVIKRASKTWPKTEINGTNLLNEAISVLNEHEGVVTGPSKESIDYYAKLIEQEDALRLYTFYQSLEIEERTALHADYVKKNAEKGGIGKLKAKIKELTDKGYSLALDYQNALESSNDDTEIEELRSELTDDDFKFIFGLLSKEAQDRINNYMRKQ